MPRVDGVWVVARMDMREVRGMSCTNWFRYSECKAQRASIIWFTDTGEALGFRGVQVWDFWMLGLCIMRHGYEYEQRKWVMNMEYSGLRLI